MTQVFCTQRCKRANQRRWESRGAKAAELLTELRTAVIGLAEVVGLMNR